MAPAYASPRLLASALGELSFLGPCSDTQSFLARAKAERVRRAYRAHFCCRPSGAEVGCAHLRRHLLAAALLLGVGCAPAIALADRGDNGVDKPTKDPTNGASPAKGTTTGSPDANQDASATAAAGQPEQKAEKKSPWSGSILLFDQSVTTQTVGVGADYNSADPVYEWWVAFKPRYT